MTELKQRKNKTALIESEVIDDAKVHDYVKPLKIHGSVFVFVVFFFGLSLFLIARFFNDALPAPVMDHQPNRFVAKRALQHLKDLVALGPKVTGTKANEIDAVNLIMERVKLIASKSNKNNSIWHDLQKASGAFQLNFQSTGSTLVYSNVQNIVVKIGPRENDKNSVLVNCHFDSVPTSPGASDDILNCAAMLEVLNVLSQSNKKLKHNVIFLFNGAEENPLLASHGFITQHPWAKQVKTFINLESCGAGGREVLFQSGPKIPWIIEKYSKVPHPSGMVVAEEVFQSGIIPSDTDFRIFRDFGNISGLDFAHCGNGYVYHTRLDNIKSIPNVGGVMQHTGDNLLSLIKSFIESKEIEEDYTEGQSVYHDLFGLCFIHMSSENAVLLNIFIAILSTIAIIKNYRTYLRGPEFLIRITVCFGALLFCCMINLTTGIIIGSLNRSMTWYSSPWMLILLYFIPTFLILSTAATFPQSNSMASAQAYSHSLATLTLWTILLAVGSFTFGIRSTYILVYLTLPPAFISLIMPYITLNKGSLYSAYLGIQVFSLFIPITGRSGDQKNPEILISLLSTFVCFAITSYFVPLIIFVKNKKTVIVTTSITVILLVIILLFTPLSFPFSETKMQRHVNKEHIGFQGNRSVLESYFWIQNIQKRGKNDLPFLKDEHTIKDLCNNDLYCGVPWGTPHSFLKSKESVYIKTKPHLMGNKTRLEVSRKMVSNTVEKFVCNVFGPDRVLLFLTPMNNAVLKAWSFTPRLPEPTLIETGKPTYLVRFVHGITIPSWSFWIEVEHKNRSNETLTMAFIPNVIHDHEISSEFSSLISKFPKTSHITPSLAVYQLYKF